MDIYKGKAIVAGVAFGEIYQLSGQNVTERAPGLDAESEWILFLSAKEKAEAQLSALYEKTKAELGEESAAIIDVQRLMLNDGDFNEAVEDAVKSRGDSAAYAVTESGKRFAEFFVSLDDEYMRARATDVMDLARRITNILLGESGDLRFDRPVVIVADDLTPSETLQMDKSKVLAFVIRQGSSHSHTAILARTMNIPCMIQTNIPHSPAIHGKQTAVDAGAGLCWVEPDEKTKIELTVKQKIHRESLEALNAMRGLPSVTKGGRAIKLFANIGGLEDLPLVLQNDSEGIGLFRSEFLYLGRKNYPSEEELFQAYRKVVEGMRGKEVVIRTLDIGADKKVAYFELDEEENPALGLRGVRICLERPELFKTQLRAIYRASAFGSVAIMFPMIASLWEVQLCKKAAEEVRSKLKEEGIPIGEVDLGIMIETPASVMIAETLAREIDFFSVGTNDLTQYTLAIDRQNSKLDRFYDPHHPAVLEMLRLVAEAAARNGIWAGICGELAADTTLTKAFIDMGYTELSASPAHTLALRRRVRELD